LGGVAATASPKAGLEVNGAANLVSLQAGHAGLAGRRGDAILDAWIFAGREMVDCVWVRGEKRVAAGRHRDREDVARRFRAVMEDLLAA
jgi:cytosine/adenosine deaminase-related metal-dependent hydrolase